MDKHKNPRKPHANRKIVKELLRGGNYIDTGCYSAVPEWACRFDAHVHAQKDPRGLLHVVLGGERPRNE